MKLARCFFVLLLLCTVGSDVLAQTTRPAPLRPFVHPGLLHTKSDLDRIKRRVAAAQEPWKAGFDKLRRDGQSRSDWRIRGPFETVTRETGNVHGNNEMVQDGNAAYQNALMWCITGDEAHARKAVEILNAWATTLRKMDGHDVQLAAGLNGFKFVNAAELMRYTYPAWELDDVRRFERMLKEAVYPPIKDFAPFANGNWDAACLKTMMAIGVFCDDRALFDRAVDYYRNGEGNGRLTHYVFDESGQCQESGRDQRTRSWGWARWPTPARSLRTRAWTCTARPTTACSRASSTPPATISARTCRSSPTSIPRANIASRRFPTSSAAICARSTRWSGTTTKTAAAFPHLSRSKPRKRNGPKAAASAQDQPGFGTLLFFRDETATARQATTHQTAK